MKPLATLSSLLLLTLATTAPPATPQTTSDQTVWLQDLVDRADGQVQLPAGTITISRPIQIDLGKTGFRGLRGAQAPRRLS